MARRQKPRKKRQGTQEASSAHGTLVDVRRNLQQASGPGDKSFKWLMWSLLVGIGLALTFAVLAP